MLRKWRKWRLNRLCQAILNKQAARRPSGIGTGLPACSFLAQIAFPRAAGLRAAKPALSDDKAQEPINETAMDPDQAVLAAQRAQIGIGIDNAGCFGIRPERRKRAFGHVAGIRNMGSLIGR